MSFPRYPAYKDSGVEWLGRLPAHWTIASPVKAFTLINGYAFPADKFADEGIPVIRMSEINCGALSLDEAKRIDADLVPSRFLLNKEDVLLGLSGSIDALAIVKEEDLPCALNQRVAAFRGREKFCTSKWAFWFFQSAAYKDQLLAILPQTTIVNVGLDDLKNVRLAAPPIDEQIAIDAFLDHETAKIDALVAEQNLLITLLKEKRQAVISHAVTKGLDPSVPMKDSGVEWLGEVPEHWDIKRIAQISAKITNGYVGPTRDILVEDGVRYLQSLHIKNNKVEFHQPYFVSEDWSNAHQKSILKTGDVLVVQTGDIGQVAVVPPEFEGCNCHALIIVSPETSSVTGEWLACVLDSDYGFHTLISIQTGALHPHLNCGNVRDVYIPGPALCEQRALVDYVAARSTEFDALIREAVLSIELLRERRSALISAAVTGQIDVRGLAPAQEQAA